MSVDQAIYTYTTMVVCLNNDIIENYSPIRVYLLLSSVKSNQNKTRSQNKNV